MKRFMRIYKKVIMIIVLCVTMGTLLFFADGNVMTTYAYTEEEKAAAKAWLSANGYPPTMDGAQQAYQDYLNGKFGPVDGGQTPGDDVPQTPDDTNNETAETAPSDSQGGNSAAESNTEEKEGSSDSETNTEKEEGDTGSETKEAMQEDGSGSEANGVMQKSGSGSETKKVTQKDGSGNKTKKEVKEGSSDNKTKAASQNEKSDAKAKAGKFANETKQAENKSTETESDSLFASGDEKTGNPEGPDSGIAAVNSEDLTINSEIAAGDLHAVENSKTSVILIIAVIGVIVLIYFIRHFYIGNKKEQRP